MGVQTNDNTEADSRTYEILFPEDDHRYLLSFFPHKSRKKNDIKSHKEGQEFGGLEEYMVHLNPGNWWQDQELMK